MADAAISAVENASDAARLSVDDGPPAIESERRRARYSLIRYSPWLFLLLIVIADAGQRADPDLWGHLRFGQAILASGHAPTHDPYSYTAAGAPWIDCEWLCEAVMAVAYNHFGIVGLKAWKLICVAGTLGFMSIGLAETEAALALQFQIMTVAAIGLMLYMQFRPQIFTYLMFAILLALLARKWFRRRGALLAVVPLMALWANLHGGFIIGLATLGAYSLGAALSDARGLGAGIRRGAQLGGLTVAATAATLANPYGIGLWRVIAGTLSNSTIRVANEDWLPLSRVVAREWHGDLSGVVFLLCTVGLIAATALAVVLAPRADDFPFVVIAAVMCVAAITAARNLPLAIIACVAPLARRLALLKRQSEATVMTRSAVNPFIAVLMLFFLAAGTGILSGRLRTAGKYPADAVEFMRRHALQGNILNEFGWGGYLIWHSSPGLKVFIDGRCETFYTSSVINQYIDFHFDLRGAQEVLDEWPHDFVLIPPAAPAYNLMATESGWRLIYRDATSALFARVGTPGALVAPLIRPAETPAVEYFP